MHWLIWAVVIVAQIHPIFALIFRLELRYQMLQTICRTMIWTGNMQTQGIPIFILTIDRVPETIRCKRPRSTEWIDSPTRQLVADLNPNRRQSIKSVLFTGLVNSSFLF